MSVPAQVVGSTLRLPGEGRVHELPLPSIRRILLINKLVALPTAEPDRAWALETADDVLLVPESSGVQAALQQAVDRHAPLAGRFYSARYSQAPVSWHVLRWNWKLLRGASGVFTPETLSRLLSRADVAGPMTWAQLKASEDL